MKPVAFTKLARREIEAAAEFFEFRNVRRAARIDTEAVALVRAFDEAWNICHHEGVIAGLYDAEVGLESGEWIIRDLGYGGGEARNERRFARIGKADQADIGEELEFEAEAQELAGFAFFMLGVSLMGRGSETSVATATAPAISGDP